MKLLYQEVLDQIGEVADLRSAAAVLEWDQETYMPDGAGEVRATQVATLRKLAHLKFIDPVLGEALNTLSTRFSPETQEASLVRVWQQAYKRAVKLPGSLVFRKSEAVGLAKEAWKTARQTNQFSVFAPHLKNIVAICQEEASAIGYEAHPYDALLDEFEPGMKTAEVAKIFGDLRTALVPIVQKIAACPAPEDDFLHQPYDEAAQWAFNETILKEVGFDFSHGRLDRSAHPFTTTFASSDVRITTRILPNYFPSALFSTLHEFGHALYEMNIAPSLNRTLANEGTSLSMHESQSRLWENQVGRSKAFWLKYYPLLQIKNVPIEDFYRAINLVKPSLIRVEADEVTYPLHIMLRFELETALIEGQLAVEDLPEAWNAKMQEYLGIKPRADAEGVLQDIHWSLGALGYFPTYALGTLMSAQIYTQALRDLGELEAQIQAGKFAPLRAWLKENIHQFGKTRTADELLKALTGKSLEATDWLAYIQVKYGEIYGF